MSLSLMFFNIFIGSQLSCHQNLNNYQMEEQQIKELKIILFSSGSDRESSVRWIRISSSLPSVDAFINGYMSL